MHNLQCPYQLKSRVVGICIESTVARFITTASVFPFNTEEASGCWSMVGTDAKGKDVTMVLDLSRHPSNVQRSLVIHEFGHALGLEHEHQRSDFWDIVGKHFDLEKMRKDPRVRAPESGDEQGGVGCETDWETKTGGDEEEYTSEYDSKSIMHYW